jgi:hypothetical protein
MTVFKGQGIDCFGNQLPTINGDISRHRSIHADLRLPTEWHCTSYQNDELPSYCYNGWIIWIDERKPTERLSYPEGERWERYQVYNWDHYHGMPDTSEFDEPFLWTSKLSEVIKWVSKRCNNYYTMSGEEIGYD